MSGQDIEHATKDRDGPYLADVWEDHGSFKLSCGECGTRLATIDGDLRGLEAICAGCEKALFPYNTVVETND